MTRAIIKHSQPSISLTFTVNINADKTLLLITGVIWLAWVSLGRLYEIGRAVVVVAWRRIRRALQMAERRIEWTFSGLAYGPVLGVG